jgi:tRNA (adenine57-N1/adenine58-N1)-methyltransferase catalytic subunit
MGKPDSPRCAHIEQNVYVRWSHNAEAQQGIHAHEWEDILIHRDQPVSTGTSSWFRPRNEYIAAGDLVLLLTAGQKRFLVRMVTGQRLHTHLGIYDHDQLIGIKWGSSLLSTMQQPALVVQPGLTDLMMHLKRGSQIIYPKDAALIVQRLNLRAGSTVIEAGTGSGVLTTALAWSVAPLGTVYTYEVRAETHQLARKNLERVGLLEYVQMFEGSIEGGFAQQDVDALFLDVREPWRYLPQVQEALCSGGFFASLLPTTNQVSDLLLGLEAHSFTDISVEELLLRSYKPVPDRLRPDENMNGHTGFLVFARYVSELLDSSRWQAKERQRYRARMQAKAEYDAEMERREQNSDANERKYPRLPLPG